MTIQAERYKSLAEICQGSRYFYEDSVQYDDDAVKKHLRPIVLEPLEALYKLLQQLKQWDSEALQQCINDVSAEFDMNMGKIAQPLRVAVTGSSVSPAIAMTLHLLGQQRTLARLELALQTIRERAASSQCQ